MLDVNYIRDHFDTAVAGLKKRNIADAAALLQKAVDADNDRKNIQFVLVMIKLLVNEVFPMLLHKVVMFFV